MGALQFVSASAGIGLTNSTLICFRRSGTGDQVSFRAQPVRLARSSDGGRSWQLMGAPAPVGPEHLTTFGEQIAVRSPARIWAIAGQGRLLVTSDAGRTWRRVRLAGPAVELAGSGADVWLLTCPRVASRAWPSACLPRLWHAPVTGGAWVRIPLPRLTAQDPDVHLTIASDGDLLLGVLAAARDSSWVMAISTDAGSTWRTRPDPRWRGHTCTASGGLAAGASRTFWVLCLGGAAAGSSTKGLLQSTDSGRNWATIAAVTNLARRPAPGSLPLAEPSALAAGSARQLWLSTTNGLSESGDGGRTWSSVSTAFDPGGWPTAISVLDARHAWLLAPGAGLWSTSDGVHWQPAGQLHTG